MTGAVRRMSTMAVICLTTAMARAGEPLTPEEHGGALAAGLTITKAVAGNADVTKALADKVKNDRLVIVATSEFLGVDAGKDKIVVEYVLNGRQQTIELSAIPGDTLGVATPGADW